jgi:hypothetical protein
MVNGALVAEAVLPALSVTDPVTCLPAPSVVTSWSGEQAATPERLSVQVKCASTCVAKMPEGLRPGDSTTPIAGAVRSMFSVTDVEALLPALSVAVPVTI